MKMISENLGRIIAALAAIALLVSCVTAFRTDVSDFFDSILGKQTSIGDKILGVMDSFDVSDKGDTNGDGQVFYTESPAALSFRAAKPMSGVQEVQVNGTAIGSTNYVMSDDGTNITLTVEYLGTLSEGTYTVTIETETGSLTVSFTVVSGSSGSDEPGLPSNPGDSDNTSTLPESGVNTETREITDTWEQIQQAIEEGVYKTRYQLGDTKTINMGSYGNVVMQVVAFDADEKADGTGTAAITWLSKDLIGKHTMNSTGTDAGGWEASEMRSWLQSDVYNALPSEVKSTIVTVNKTYYNRTTRSMLTCADNVWIPSYCEMFGAGTYETSGATYTSYFTSQASRVKHYKDSATHWWLRSAYRDPSGLFVCVADTGNRNQHNANMTLGVALGFSM